MLVIGIGAAVGYVSALLKGLPTISASTITNLNAASVVYDRNGKVIGRFTRDGDRQPITSVNQVSPYLSDAFIAAEDKTFYHNIGVNPLAMLRAFTQNIISHHIESGASTITQETVKLAVFPEQQRTMKRKIQEIALAIELNHILSKDEILTDYMNWVYMGHLGNQNVYGVKTASEVLFHKDPKALNLPESAFIAAIVNNPLYLSPYQYPSHTVDRQRWILGQMLRNQMIDQHQYNQAIHFDILKDVQKRPNNFTKYPYLMDNVQPLVDRSLVSAGLYDTTQEADQALATAGYKIYTTIDLSMQQDVDRVLSNEDLFKNTDMPVPGVQNQKDLYQAGVSIVDNQTGGILAIGGGRPDRFQQDQIDHSDIARQPGSSIKPLIDYGPAIDTEQLTAGDVIDDVPTVFNKGTPYQYTPHDDEDFWHGIVTVRQALVESLNVPAVKVLEDITPEVGTSYLAKVGIRPNSTTIAGKPTLIASDEDHLGSAIGGLQYGLTVQQMTNAYTVFPNQGVWRQSFLINKVTDGGGTLLYQAKPQVQKVFSPQTAYIMTSILHDVVYQPTGTAIAIGQQFPGYFISGKTGTSDQQQNGWFIGYTQKYTAGIWMGYNHNQPIPTSIYGLKFKIWSDIMKPILQSDPPTKPFAKPIHVQSVAICKKSGQLPTALCKQDNDVYNELFIDGTQPTLTCQVHEDVQYVVLNGKKYLATTNTPLSQVRTGLFLNPLWPTPNVRTLDSSEYAPTQPDPRGGDVLGGTFDASGSPVETPTNVLATLGQDGVQLTWDAVEGATGYSVWRATSEAGPYTEIVGPMIGTSYLDADMPTTPTTYYYEIRAQNDVGMSDPSPSIAVEINSGTIGSNTTGDTNSANSVDVNSVDGTNPFTGSNPSNGADNWNPLNSSSSGNTMNPAETNHLRGGNSTGGNSTGGNEVADNRAANHGVVENSASANQVSPNTNMVNSVHGVGGTGTGGAGVGNSTSGNRGAHIGDNQTPSAPFNAVAPPFGNTTHD